MPNTNETLFIVMIAIVFALVFIGVFIMMVRTNARRKELIDLEQRLQAQEQHHLHYIVEKAQLDLLKPAMIKEGHVVQPILTQKSKRDSILNRVYGFRKNNEPTEPQRPSSIRPPSFLPMQLRSPPAYGDYRTSVSLMKANTMVESKV
ncbi:hypothetical protein K501DRAFT_288896 [Backusella circina FSU 941]|nr:hypothetical protein K501DRAFT_288896 [Backusella circina FSU 941]